VLDVGSGHASSLDFPRLGWMRLKSPKMDCAKMAGKPWLSRSAAATLFPGRPFARCDPKPDSGPPRDLQVQSHVVVDGMAQLLFTAKVPFCRLD
jgi:hypothetical protein